jgi:hypothetical protein
MKYISLPVSSAATIMYCTVGKARCKCTWAEQSESVGSYQGEILSGIMTQSILKAAATGCNKKILHVGVDIDSNNVVTHGNKPCNSLWTNKTQADLLQVFNNLVANQPFSVKYKYVKAHADDMKRWCDCMLKERTNSKVDGLPKKSLKTAMSTGKFIDSVFPNNQIWIEMG